MEIKKTFAEIIEERKKAVKQMEDDCTKLGEKIEKDLNIENILKQD